MIAPPINKTPHLINPNGVIGCKLSNDIITEYINNFQRHINIFDKLDIFTISSQLERTHNIIQRHKEYEYEYTYKNIHNHLEIYKIDLKLKDADIIKILNNTQILKQNEIIEKLQIDNTKIQLNINALKWDNNNGDNDILYRPKRKMRQRNYYLYIL